MLLSLKNHISFLSVILVWIVAGAVNQFVGVGVVLGTLLLFFIKERYYEALLGFLVLLIFSDSFEANLKFAGTVKPIYLVIMTFLTFKISDVFVKNYNFIIRFGPFLLVALFCIIFSPIPLISGQKLLSYGLLLLTVPNLLIYEYKRHGDQLLVTLVSITFLIFSLCIFAAIFLPEIGTSHGGRWRGIFGNPNGLGLFLTVYYLFFRVVSNKVPNSFTRFDLVIYYAFFFTLLWKCGSRNALLSVLIVEIVARGFQYSRAATILVLVTVVTFIDVILDFGLSILISAGLKSELRLENIDEGSGRLIAWQFAYEEIRNGMIVLGKGLGYDEYFMGKNYNFLSNKGHQGGVHNTYLILWLNTGLLGLIAFFSAFLSFYLQAFKKSIFAFGSMLAILSSISYEPWLSASLNPFTIGFIMLMVVFLYLDDEDETGAINSSSTNTNLSESEVSPNTGV